MSKITVAGVRTNVQSLLAYSLEEKKRNFLYVLPFSYARSQDLLGSKC